MTDDESLPVPLVGTTLLLGPSNAGKTTETARAIERWVDTHGPEGVVVFDFAPELNRGDEILGGRLDRVTDLLDDDAESTPEDQRAGRTRVSRPNGLWYGVLDAHAPRAESSTDEEALALARTNASGAASLLERAPTEPRAVFVNDATIATQHPTAAADTLLAYCHRAYAAVLNAFESDELGVDDPVSRQERTALETLVAGADRVTRLSRRP